MQCAAFNRFCPSRKKRVFVLISSKAITEKKQGIKGTAQKWKITCDFCNKHPVVHKANWNLQPKSPAHWTLGYISHLIQTTIVAMDGICSLLILSSTAYAFMYWPIHGYRHTIFKEVNTRVYCAV